MSPLIELVNMNSIVNNKMSPRIGILGVSTFPSEQDFLNPDGSQFISGSLQSKDNFGFGSSQVLPGKIDDVSSSVNK